MVKPLVNFFMINENLSSCYDYRMVSLHSHRCSIWCAANAFSAGASARARRPPDSTMYVLFQ